MKHIIRIEPDWLRIPLLCMLFPACLLAHMAEHPRKHRLLQAEFYRMPVALFWAAWDGQFVPYRKTPT